MNESQSPDRLNVEMELENAIQMFENMQQVQIEQWLTVTDALCLLYLMKAIVKDLKK